MQDGLHSSLVQLELAFVLGGRVGLFSVRSGLALEKWPLACALIAAAFKRLRSELREACVAQLGIRSQQADANGSADRAMRAMQISACAAVLGPRRVMASGQFEIFMDFVFFAVSGDAHDDVKATLVRYAGGDGPERLRRFCSDLMKGMTNAKEADPLVAAQLAGIVSEWVGRVMQLAVSSIEATSSERDR